MTSTKIEKPAAMPAYVRRLQERLGRWRANKGAGPEPIPPKLWEAAVRLCASHTVSRVSKWLRLHHTTLRNRVNGRATPGSRRSKPNFVEWNLPAGNLVGVSSAEYVIEAPVREDAAQRIHARGASVSEVAALARALRADVSRGRD